MEGRLLGLDQVLGVGNRGGEQPQPGVADLELLPVLQGMLLDLLAGDERPADAIQVGQRELGPLPSQLAMEPSHGPVRQPGVGLLAPADRERGPLDQVEDATLIRAGHYSQISVHGEPPFWICSRPRVRRESSPGIRGFARTRAGNRQEMRTSRDAIDARNDAEVEKADANQS